MNLSRWMGLVAVASTFSGPARGVSHDRIVTGEWTATSSQSGSLFGTSVSPAGDVNGDGYGDVLVGAPLYGFFDWNEGKAYLYLGSASGLQPADWRPEFEEGSVYFGTRVASAGDVNGDGYGDVLVAAPDFDAVDEGRAYLYLGSAAGLERMAAWTVGFGHEANYLFDWALSSSGDVNCDGYADVLVGAPLADDANNPHETNEGRVYLYLGSATGLETSAAWTAESDHPETYFGNSVSSAGDVNGDGCDDVLVGASAYTNEVSGEGRAYLYLGSPVGLEATPAWTTDGGQVGAALGWDVSSAGDVNGDGYGDVMVGSPYYSTGPGTAGRVWLYLGSATGLGPTAAWTADSFGDSLSSGDVNADGYADVLFAVGGVSYSKGSKGQVILYLGSATGPETRDAWTAESDQLESEFGYSVSSAGDVNGDGSDDVLVGAPYYDDGLPDDGRVYLYLGLCGTDADDDGACAGYDCDDGDATVYPGAIERCDGRSNACAEIPTDEADLDSDGVLACAGDCDDHDPTSYGGASEICDEVDNDCDAVVDEDCSGDATPGEGCGGCSARRSTAVAPFGVFAALLVSIVRRKRRTRG